MNSRTFYGLILLISFTIGCSDDEELNSNCRIVTIESIASNSTSIQTFTYDTENRISSGSFSRSVNNNTIITTAEFTYDETGRLTKIFNNDSLFTDITYRGDTILVSRPFLSGIKVSRFLTTYLVDEQNRITDLVNFERYEYNDQNQLTRVLSLSGVIKSEQTYDQNPNPLEGFLAIANVTLAAENDSLAGELIVYFDFGFLLRGPNNVMESKFYSNGNVFFENRYEIEYNSTGYPVRVTEPTNEVEVIYTYECP